MTSPARIEANRRNAQKSTGPRTDEGKERSRLNALKHGLDAKTAVLPHEDAEKYEHRREAWTRELSPGSDVGDYLAGRAVKLSWQLDRADAHEHAELAHRVRDLPRERERSRRRRAAELLRKVLVDDTVPDLRQKRPPGRADWLARLEATAHGCRALLDAWDGVSAMLSAGGGWAEGDLNVMLRLLGAVDRREAARSGDPRLVRVAAVFDEALRVRQADGTDDDAARAELLAIVAAERGRLLDLRKTRRAEQGDLPAEDAARAAFDRSKEGERVHRYQNQWGRALIQTLRAVAALAPALAASTEEEQASAPAVEQPAATAPTAAPERSQTVEDKSREHEDLREDPCPRSRPRPGAAAASRPEPATARRIADLEGPPAEVRAPAA